MNGWYAILAAVGGWFVAQASKVVIGLLDGYKQSKKSDLKTVIGYLTRSGGMPSGHSACMAGLTTYLGIAGGFDTGLFALALVMTMIVIYDAIHVRYAVGEQGKTLNKLLEKDGQEPLPVVEGHTMAQAVVGVLIGIVIGVIVGVLTKA